MIEIDDRPYPANRLRESREYVGLKMHEVAAILGTSASRLEAYESGFGWLPEAWEQRLSDLYRKSIACLRGEDEGPLVVPADVAEKLEETSLSENDRAEVLKFVAYLQKRAVEPEEPST